MKTTKLTLSADKDVIASAKRLAKKKRTSVSAMFAHFIESMRNEDAESAGHTSPLTRQASGMIRLPEDRTYRELLEDSLAERYREPR